MTTPLGQLIRDIKEGEPVIEAYKRVDLDVMKEAHPEIAEIIKSVLEQVGHIQLRNDGLKLFTKVED